MFLTIKNLNIPPSKKNSRIISTINGRVRSFASKNYSIWHAQAFYMIKNQLGMSFNTIDFPCEIDILFGRKNNRKWDLTNKAESVMDLLVDCKVLKDDNYTIASKITLSSVKSDTDFVNIKISKYQK